MDIIPYSIRIPQTVLDDLKERLANTRWPDEVEASGWDYGTNMRYLQELVHYWLHQYDWRKQEAELNRFDWFVADVNGQEYPFIHARGKGPNPTPIILFHGWPDSIYRYLKLIPMLTDPAKYGGDPNDSFDVIVPHMIAATQDASVPARPQYFKQSAEQAWRLMTEGLGYARFAAGGGDGGSPLSQLLAIHHPTNIIGLHLTDVGYHTSFAQYDDLSEIEQQYLQAAEAIGYQENAYSLLQGTRPQTLAIGLNDSPVGLAAWIIEKMRTWSDCGGDLESRFTKDELLSNIMLYWIYGFDPRGYREEWVTPSLQAEQLVFAPVGLAQPPKDVNPVTPREFADRNLKNIQRFTVLEHGGHFVAWEFPELMAADIRALFHELKIKTG